MELIQIAEKFELVGKVVSVEPYGEGHINRTYLVTTDKQRYIMQKINTALFTNVEALMNNIVAVTEFIKNKTESEGKDSSRCTLIVIPTKDGKKYFTNEEGSYRTYEFIEGAKAYQSATAELFKQSGVAFGKFANDLSKFNASVLYEVLPSFHDTTVRYQNFLNAIKNNKSGRANKVQAEIEFVKSREKYCGILVNAIKNGEIPLRVTHNDTKLNNVMLDNVTGEPVAVIDLDTVMPGSVCYDFGDSIRFGCNTGKEDDENLDNVTFSKALYDSYYDGYVSAFPSITDRERELLPYSALLMTFECGMRFLTDYLDGDTYFRTTRENHNLDRCHTQFKLVEEMEKIFNFKA